MRVLSMLMNLSGNLKNFIVWKRKVWLILSKALLKSSPRIVLDSKVPNVLDCSGGQLDTSVCRIAILLLVNNMGGGIFKSLSEDAGYNLIRDFKKTDRTDRADLVSWFVWFRNTNDLS